MKETDIPLTKEEALAAFENYLMEGPPKVNSPEYWSKFDRMVRAAKSLGAGIYDFSRTLLTVSSNLYGLEHAQEYFHRFLRIELAQMTPDEIQKLSSEFKLEV